MAASNSPLKPYANSFILIKNRDEVTQNHDGRWAYRVSEEEDHTQGLPAYLVKCYMCRKQYDGVTSGSRKIPLPSELKGEMLPGASGDAFYYRGYALEYAEVEHTYDLDDPSASPDPTYNIVDQQFYWMLPGVECQFKFGDDPLMPTAKIERSSGQFGGQGIDQILYPAIGGVQLQISGGEVQN